MHRSAKLAYTPRMFARAFVAAALLVGCSNHAAGGDDQTGPPGPQGPAGPQGPPGEVTVLDGGTIQGPPGPQGPAGPAGATGPTGAMGAMGLMGLIGPMGATGATGAPGSQGPMGMAGGAGPAGPSGPQGVTGAQGPGGGVTGEPAAVFAGFTPTTYTGVAGGREVMNQRCSAAFSGSHLCHVAEYGLANSATVIPAAGVWIDSSAGIENVGGTASISNNSASVELGRYVGGHPQINCTNWTAAIDSSTNPTLAEILTAATTMQLQCTNARSLACCSTPYTESFRGFTTAQVSGVRPGGRAEMHQICGAQFPGSHLCHVAEYERASSTVPPPAAGAWIDSSSYLRSSGGSNIENTLAAVQLGRYIGGHPQINCTNWTAAIDSSTNPTLAEVLTTATVSQTQCTTTHPLACCE